MADELDGLLARVDDPALRADLRAHIDRIRAKRTFGLVFESHLPERVRLPEHPIRPGAKVALRDDPDSATYRVLRVHDAKATVRTARLPDGSRLSAEEEAEADDEIRPVADLVVIADFGEAVYPGLRTLGSIDRGGDKPAHVVIKGENHHVLEALRFTHAGKVDCIYIDPPYNTGARDWKYNNDYVDDHDAYRHSKWLAFMRRRLTLAAQLLNQERSVLIVTVDEHEVHRLRMLLEQTFPSARIQMVTIVVNPKGVAQGGFARVEEYALYCFFGSASVAPTEDDYLSDDSTQRNTRFWKGLLRAGTNARPSDGLGMAYPIYIDTAIRRIHSVGRTMRERIATAEITGDPDRWLPTDEAGAPEGTVAVWPIRRDGSLGVWQAVPETLLSLAEAGLTKCVLRAEGWAISYVPAGVRSKIDSTEIAIVGYDPSGSAILERQRDLTRAKTVWKRARHDAGWHGSVVLRRLLGDRVFDFPKSLYAVRDALAPIIGTIPDATVVDFFAGSGTTAHAVTLLNRADGGRRVTISVTNNEVSAPDANALVKLHYRPGDPAWEAKGVFSSVTMPRITAAVEGIRPDGEPVDLVYPDETPAAEGFEENVTFAELVYLDPDDVELRLAFAAIAPLLWLRAGAQGPIVDECVDAAGRRRPYAWTERYGVLFNPDRWRGFVGKRPATATTAFVVTDSQAVFAGIAAELPDHLDVVRLYENYLTTFRINEGLG